MDHKMSMAGKAMTRDEKVATALTAAPASVVAKATRWRRRPTITGAIIRRTA